MVSGTISTNVQHILCTYLEILGTHFVRDIIPVYTSHKVHILSRCVHLSVQRHKTKCAALRRTMNRFRVELAR